VEKLQLARLKPASARQYDFYLMPKLLIDHEAFDGIDYGAKLLYSLMLSRASLSATNAQDFTDDNGDLYIIYTVEQVMEHLRCSTKTAVKMLKQLDDIGLIEKKRQGQGKPSIIYVNDFATVQFKNCKKYNSRSVECTSQEVQKVQSNYNDLSNNNFSEHNHSHSQSQKPNGKGENIRVNSHSQGDIVEQEPDWTNDNDGEEQKEDKKKDFKNAPTVQSEKRFKSSYEKPIEDDYTIYEQIIKENINYEGLLSEIFYNPKGQPIRKYDEETLQELVNCMLDVICTKGETVKINGEEKSREMVKSVYLKLRQDDIEHIIDRYESVHHKVTHLHSYLKTMLYTISQEHGHYYTNAVRADGMVR